MNFVIHPQRQTSAKFSKTREQLRELARVNNIPRGRNIGDTVKNLRAAGYKID